MEVEIDNLTKFDITQDKRNKYEVSSAYLWRGFSGDLQITTYNVFTRVNITDIALGDKHSLFLSDTGEVFVSGSNDMAQLGIGSLEVKLVEEPVKVNGLPGQVTQVACGRHHSAVVTTTGQVFCWGLSKDGQCGTGSLDLVLAPTQVVVEINKGFCQHGVPKPTLAVPINSVACGSSHCLAVSEDGEVWSWGYGPQLGLDDLKHAPIPRIVDALEGHFVVAVCCGDQHSMALVLKDENKSSRSSSPLKTTKGKTEAKTVLVDELYPSRCSICNKEIYTYTDTSDMCVIDTLHHCNVNDTADSVDSTIIEDVSSSSSSEVLKRSATASPEEGVEPASQTDHETDNLPQGTRNEADDSGNQSSLLDNSSILETSGFDTSVLVIPAENPFERDDSNQSTDDTEKTKPALETTGNSLMLQDDTDHDETKLNQQLEMHDEQRKENLAEEYPHSVDTEDASLEGLSDCIDEELRVLRQSNRKRSPSTTSVKSFDLSGAREYLQRQFEDEKSAETFDGVNGSPDKTSAVITEVLPTENTSLSGDSFKNKVSSSQASITSPGVQRTEACQGVAESSLQQPPHNQVSTATDVWVWGCNEQGQLGLGDQLVRAQPTLVKMFVGRHVIKLAAGEKHCLALTANSQVYSWGCNSYGQLGQTEAAHAPTRIKFMKGFTAWDIGAGAAHSVFLGDTAEMESDVLFCGKQPSKDIHSSLKKTSSPVSLEDVKQLGWITKIMAGGTGCACKVLNPAPPESEAVFELAASERAFYNQLIKTSNLLLRPLQKSNFYTSMGVYPYKTSLRNLVVTFGALTKKIGEGITDLTRCIQNNTPLCTTHMLGSHSEFIEVFRMYSRSFSDFLSVGGFDYCTRTGSEFFDKIQGSIRDLSDEQDKTVASQSLFLRAMRYPFFRLAEYSRLIVKIATAVTNPEVKSLLENVVLAWEGLKINLPTEHKTADATRVFWETFSQKLPDSLRTPERRVLRESKTHPLQMPAGGRFTSRLFVLFNDAFLMQTTSMSLLPLETVWVESGTSEDEHTNAITVVAPEERLELMASTAAEKAEWLMALNSAISKVLTNRKSLPCAHGSGERFTPPLIRHASHTFTKHGVYKDAIYTGTWLSGKVHGLGTLKWPDGTKFEGHFQKGQMHGSGIFTVMKGKGIEVQKGNWKDGKLHGFASVSYANGDLYEGHFQDGQRFGHGKYQSGRQKSSCVSVYIGEWLNNLREGYGVQDDLLKGEKYMGMWTQDQRHGAGVMVTLDGMYFEGSFQQNKLTGFGIMISDDNTIYEGDFMDITHLSGKGILTLSSGDKLEGMFSGTLNEGLKVNGTFIKSPISPEWDQRMSSAGVKSVHFGQLGVSADSKWTDIFSHAAASLGHSGLGKVISQEETDKAWEIVAVMLTTGRHAVKEGLGISPSKLKVQQKTLEGLEKIPSHSLDTISTEVVDEISAYLAKACDTIYHPVGQLMDNLVDVFRASYIGVGAHPRLLHHAVLEMRSYVSRLYQIVRILFPALPVNGGPLYIYPPSKSSNIPQTTEDAKKFLDGLETDDSFASVFTATGLLYPILLPKIYPPLIDLYALYNEKNDDRYWERVTKLNRQSDMGLMAYLGIEQRFWLMEDLLQQDKSHKLSTIKDVCYAQAVDTLQQLSTAFSPIEKLKIIEQTFNEITKTVALSMKDDHMWCMDDLFPIFQFVVVRAKIHHLCAEIHMIDDLMESHMEHGELGLMFTTLKACYFQIQNEKLPHH
ncbi:hypothetical protein BsWGS_18666 [Bradybaena similaris]